MPFGRVGRRLLAVVGLATILGLAFNAANPLGVRWGEEASSLPEGGPAGPAETSPVEGAVVPAAPGVANPAPVIPAPTMTAASDAAAAAAVAGPAFITPSATHWNAVKPLAEQGKLLLLDARSKAAFEAGHIPGAISLPQSSSDDVLAAFRGEHPPETHLVVYCSSTSCSLSFKLAYRLAKDFGFTHVEFMTGGYFEYQRARGLAESSGGATTTAAAPGGVAPAPPSSGQGKPVSGAVGGAINPTPVSWPRAQQWRTELGAVLVDARPAEAFAAGHVPGAVSLPLDASPEQFATFAATHKSDRPVIVYGAVRGEVSGFLTARKLMRKHGFHAARFTNEGYQEWLAEQDKQAGGDGP